MTDRQAIVAFLRRLALTASSDQARGAYIHAAEAIERGEDAAGRETFKSL